MESIVPTAAVVAVFDSKNCTVNLYVVFTEITLSFVTVKLSIRA